MSVLQRAARRLANPFMRMGQAYNETAKRWPISTGVATTVVKTCVADLFAQKVVEQREQVDWRRNGLFTAFGFAYLGYFQYWLYNDIFSRICRPITMAVGHTGSAFVKTFIDQCIHHPLFYFPCFYVCKGAVEGRPVASSLAKYQQDMWENCKALWMVWVPAQLVNFAMVPRHLRIPFVAAVSFAWTVIISVMRGTLDTLDDPAEVPVREPAVMSSPGLSAPPAGWTLAQHSAHQASGIWHPQQYASLAMALIIDHHAHHEEGEGPAAAGPMPMPAPAAAAFVSPAPLAVAPSAGLAMAAAE